MQYADIMEMQIVLYHIYSRDCLLLADWADC